MAPRKRFISSGVRSVIKLTFSPYLDRTRLAGNDAVEQMADDFRMLVTSCGGVTTDDLEALGWPKKSVTAYSNRARDMATAASVETRAARRVMCGMPA